MSTPQESLPAGVTIFGGVPIESQDQAASIVFIVAYVLLLPLAAFRLSKSETRHRVLFKPVLFTLIRVASFGIRAGEAAGNYSVGLFIAEQILILCGGLMLVEPVVQMLEKHVGARLQRGSEEGITALIKVLRLMRMALIAALALGIYAGTQYSTSMSASDIADVRTYRLAGGGIGVAVSGLLILLTLLFSTSLPIAGTTWLLVVSALCCLASSYKLYIVIHPESPFALSTKILFYVLCGATEWLVDALFLAVELPRVFPRLHEQDPPIFSAITSRVQEHFNMGRPMAQRPQPVYQHSYSSEEAKSYA